MIIYSNTKEKFQNDIETNNISSIISDIFFDTTGRHVGVSEKNSWENSLGHMYRILNDDSIPNDAGIAIEYHIPQSSKRVDFIISGLDSDKSESVIIIELKQWQTARITEKDGVVITRFMHGEVETPHPSYQAWSYKRLISDYNQTVEEDKIKITPCAYLHNYIRDNIINNDFYKEYTKEAPLFLKEDAIKLRDFIKKHVRYGDKNKIMYRIDHGKIRPSKALADQLNSMLQGNQEFIMIDDQKIVFETAMQLARESSEINKNVLIIQGGPGTGKSVVAINLLVELTNKQLMVQYITRNSAPREVYKKKLTGTFTNNHISNFFSGSGSYHSLESNSYDVLIVDEAHRLNAKSGMFSHLGYNQVKEIINSSKLSVFFIDEDQKVTLKDIGSKEEIRKHAKDLGVSVFELELNSQFRCNGSDGYLSWLDNILEIKETANFDFEIENYDFQIINDPQKLHDIVVEKNKEKNKARIVAGYCWKWISQNNDQLKDIEIGNYKATWNLRDDGQAWIIQPNSVREVGCIHTCQGLEVDYIGVIVGPDLVVRNGKVETIPEARASTDRSIHGWRTLMRSDPEGTKKRLDLIIKNTYRTLMTRGMKGCYVYFTDKETERYFLEKLKNIKTKSS